MNTNKLLDKIEEFLKDLFKKRKYFACVYGSYANGHANKNSDVDILIASKAFDEDDLRKIRI